MRLLRYRKNWMDCSVEGGVKVMQLYFNYKHIFKSVKCLNKYLNTKIGKFSFETVHSLGI